MIDRKKAESKNLLQRLEYNVV